MALKAITKSFLNSVKQSMKYEPVQNPNLFGLKDILQPEKKNVGQYKVTTVAPPDYEIALDLIKQYYLPKHVMVAERGIDLHEDNALNEYLISLLRKGDTLFAKTDEGSVAGICVNFACCPVDPKNIRDYAFYRQDPCTRDFLRFTAKLHEVPNLWEAFNVQKYYDIHMLAVIPEHRRRGIAGLLATKSTEHAFDMGYTLVRMNCINQYDHKIAENSMMSCVSKFPLHRLREGTTPFIEKDSENNRRLRVYVAACGATADLVAESRTNKKLDVD